MDNAKINRRTKMTKMILKDSLLELIRHKPISKVTIKEICELADMNRSTFYFHYTDQYDLMQQVEQGIIQELNAYINEYIDGKDPIDEYLAIEKILEYMLQNKEVFIALLNGNGSKEFANHIADMVRQYSINEWLRSGAVELEIAEYLYTFAELGGSGLMIKWVNDGYVKPPAEMAALIIKIIRGGVASFMDGEAENI
ncbi:MAG: TetR family transcriptional regulator C-terminal domain-containing protein [Gorillibacterium sp.]|nr:TetR family transcriptional regulator C-terminal domain-containing protein [Gorillibacterium sp.]